MEKQPMQSAAYPGRKVATVKEELRKVDMEITSFEADHRDLNTTAALSYSLAIPGFPILCLVLDRLLHWLHDQYIVSVPLLKYAFPFTLVLWGLTAIVVIGSIVKLIGLKNYESQRRKLLSKKSRLQSELASMPAPEQGRA